MRIKLPKWFVLTIAFICLAIGLLSLFAMHIPDLIWVQETSITITSSNFNKCVRRAVLNVPEVTLNNGLSQPNANIFVLNNTLRGTPTIQIVRPSREVARITIAGREAIESDAERAIVTPLLTKLSEALSSECK
jgi:hypothetical protein